jgi:hypothetical protein
MVSGTDQPLQNILSMFLYFVGVLAAIALAVAVSAATPPSRSWDSELKYVGLAATLAVIPLAQSLPLGKVFPLVTLAALGAGATTLWKLRHERRAALRSLALVMWCAFATAMLAKIGLRASVYGYGFYLALPAVTVAVMCLCAIIPDALDRWRPGRVARDFRLFATLAIGAAVVPHLGLSNRLYAAKTEAIGQGGDRFYVSNDQNAPAARAALPFRDAVKVLGSSLKTGETVAVVPEGVMLNYLLRVDTPLQVVTMMPPELVTFGESAISESLRTSPPTYVVFVHKDAAEYGYPLFGTSVGYGESTMGWIKAHYQPFETFGSEPLSRSGYGIEIFRILRP